MKADLPSYESNRFRRNASWRGDFPYDRTKRFLYSRCGQHFDTVFSEYCKADWVPVEYRSLYWFKRHVEIDTFIENGEIFYRNYLFRQEAKSIKDENSTHFFYVHPISKVLIHKPHTGVPSYKERKKEKQKEFFRFLAAGHQLIKYKGIWYEYTFTVDEFEQGSFNKETGKFDQKRRSQKDIDRDSTEPVYCPHEKKLVTWWNYWPRIKNVKRRQLSGKELKSFGLTND
jgi:hypothetical protein